ncbi:MAG: hypothetical protein HY870_19085 [Chloroflexi bacterium]|nr:hypothetical protein [Chloroflexota bacterium]
MTIANFSTSATPQLVITCHNDLSITGGSEAAVNVVIDDDSPANLVERNGETISITAVDSCDVVCPTGASIAIEQVSGDLRVTQIKGTLAIQTVNGDAAVRDVGATDVQTVQGDFAARDVDGDLRIGTVRGDAKIKRVGGQVTADRISGDLVAQDLDTGAVFNQVAGDAALEIEFAPDQTYTTNARGDIILRINGGGAQLALKAGGDVRSRLPMTNWQGNEHEAIGTFGDGSAKVALNAGGDLLVLPGKSGSGFDPGAFSDQVESMIESAMGQFESQMARVQRELEERWGKNNPLERAAERAKRSAERAQRRAERAAGSWGTFATPPRPPAPPKPAEPVSDAERLVILKMVEAGQISVDEAAKLLASLEG